MCNFIKIQVRSIILILMYNKLLTKRLYSPSTAEQKTQNQTEAERHSHSVFAFLHSPRRQRPPVLQQLNHRPRGRSRLANAAVQQRHPHHRLTPSAFALTSTTSQLRYGFETSASISFCSIESSYIFSDNQLLNIVLFDLFLAI